MSNYAKVLTFWILVFITFFLAGQVFAGDLEKDNRIKIAVIDTGFDISHEEIRPWLCARGHHSFGKDLKPLNDNNPIKHGTNVVGLIADQVDPLKYCILIIKLVEGKDSSTTGVINAIDYAIFQKVSFLNLSIVGPNSFGPELAAVKRALQAGLKIAVSAGNAHTDLNKNCNYFPACYARTLDSENFHVVGAFDTHIRFSNYGKIVEFREKGDSMGNPPCTGTSQATAIHLGKWASGEIQ